jgi:hypothetical protein
MVSSGLLRRENLKSYNASLKICIHDCFIKSLILYWILYNVSRTRYAHQSWRSGGIQKLQIRFQSSPINKKWIICCYGGKQSNDWRSVIETLWPCTLHQRTVLSTETKLDAEHNTGSTQVHGTYLILLRPKATAVISEVQEMELQFNSVSFLFLVIFQGPNLPHAGWT